ncbi:lipoprotein signal peptidase [Bryobacterales bacterium F-183]|nr:lipoprotein signal peptidase [Bryobacterales bacterium F-183]
MNPRLAALTVAGLIVVFDQWTKLLVRQKLSLSDSITVIPGFFNLVHAENPGAAFSMLAGASQAVRSVLLIGLASVIILLLGAGLFGKFHIVTSPVSRWAVSLVLGGAVGNLIDRVRVGTVTDFLEFYLGNYYWPSFNVADSAIFCGAVLLFAEQWLHKPKPEPNVS